MAFSIKSPEADRLARELSAVTGENLTEAVLAALRERLQRVNSQQDDTLIEDLNAIARRCAALPERDSRSTEEILGYDEHGLPS